MRTARVYTYKDRTSAPDDSTFHYHRALYSAAAEQINPRLLLIDDDQIYSTLFSDCAASLNFDVKVVNDYKDLTILEQENFDIAIVDYDLGPVNGQEISSILYALFGPIPIILISATNRQYSEDSSRAEIYDFMHKSLGAGAILDAAMDAHEWWGLDNA